MSDFQSIFFCHCINCFKCGFTENKPANSGYCKWSNNPKCKNHVFCSCIRTCNCQQWEHNGTDSKNNQIWISILTIHVKKYIAKSYYIQYTYKKGRTCCHLRPVWYCIYIICINQHINSNSNHYYAECNIQDYFLRMNSF